MIEAVVLAIDPAKHTSGAAILIPDYGNPMFEEEHDFEGNYVLAEFGKVVSQEERQRFVESFLEEAMEMELPPVVVAEEWDPPRTRMVGGNIVMDPKWTYTTVLGIGEGWGLWSAELLTASEFLQSEENLPPLPVVRVKPNDWRGAVLPSPLPKDATALKETAKRVFEGVFGIKASDDISEAGCIALWATKDPGVAEAAEAWVAAKPAPKPKPKRKKDKKRQKRR
jgi:hypothetical protein